VFRAGFARCPLDGEPLVQITDDPLAGSTFADRYVIEDCVGEGGMGRVYRARHQRVSRQFAVKVLFGDHAAEKKMRDRFAREAEAACRLSHANVVSVLDFGETEAGILYLVMDWVEGVEMTSLILDHAPLEARRIADLTRQMCLGLEHAHGKGLIHRDFKAENVIVTRGSEGELPRILDFGIAVLREHEGTDRLTTEGIVLGTPAYMSPEQATGEELDPRTDLFSLGVLMYEMLCGVLPFEGPPLVIARKNLASIPPRISERVPGLEVDAGLEAISRRLMEKRAAERFQSAREVIDALDEWSDAQDAPTPAAIAAPARISDDLPAVEPERRRGLGIAVAALAFLALAGGVAFLALRDDGEATAAADPVDAPATDAAPVALVATIDAGLPIVVTDVPPPDAAPVRVAVRDPKRTGRPAVIRKTGPKPDAAPPPAPKDPPPKDPPPKDPPVSRADLEALYVSVGESIEALAKQHGAAAAKQFRDEYFRIPFADALRTPSLRSEVDAKLRKLRKRVAVKRGG
jgi:serine/threonine-protein kinase